LLERSHIHNNRQEEHAATFVEIRAIHAKDISPLSVVKSENELALSPNTMFKVVACYTSEHLNNLRGAHCVVLYAAET
jgi:hypothetical protein